MKFFIGLFILLFFRTAVFAQTEKVEIKIVDSIPLSKTELYVRAKAFLANSFNSLQHVIQMDDKEAGVIICKGSMDVLSKGTFGIKYINNVDFTIKIDIKEGKYRAIISDLRHTGLGNQDDLAGGAIENEKPSCGTLFIPKKDWAKMKDAIQIKATSFLEDLKLSMHKEVKKDDF
jgi:hypothetical protein